MEKGSEGNKPRNYKFKELKIYSSTEWLADNKKKYRQVFERKETSYVYAELSFYNRLFDRDVWEINVNLKCFNVSKSRKEVCSLDFKKKISKYDNVVFLREGWGNKKHGVFWKKGTYVWEAWLEDEKVASKYFYIEEAPEQVEDDVNPFLAVSSMRLYEGQYDDVQEEERNYLKAFSSDESRYIYVEMLLKNLHKTVNWHCELFIRFYNEARELKGQVNRLQSIKKREGEISIAAGWGSNVKGSWRAGRYTVEIIFMDKLLAVVPFEVGSEFVEGRPEIHLPYKENNTLQQTDLNLNKSYQQLLGELDALVGLEEVKRQVKEHAQYLQFLKLRKKNGFEESEELNIHSVFTGNPGTGKTTVAQMMGALYKKMGLLSKGHVHEVDRVDLVGEYIGQTAPKVKNAIKQARGGVLFIDEAYALARANDDSKDFGREVIEILVKEMSNGKGDMAVIVAGYPKEMTYFIDSNPGLKSRFKHFFTFKDYLPNELIQIANYACEAKEVKLSDGAQLLLNERIIKAFRDRDQNFGNARFVFDLIEKAKVNLGLRIMKTKQKNKLSFDDLATIIPSDVEALNRNKERLTPNIPIDHSLLNSSIKELNALIGIDSVKKEILELVDIVKFHKATDRDVLSKFFLHTIFIGNPGTGKTTVARILTKIYKALGILERGHIVETDRQGLVAGFVGQTAIKTSERIDESLGGVLFIDEAYALSNFNGMQGDFGNEAIQTILKRMEDERGAFFVFAAGYPDNMKHFLNMNPGLKSRFDKVFHFEDYNAEQLSQICQKMIEDEGYKMKVATIRFLEEHIFDIHSKRDKYFGNARTARKIVSEAIKAQNLRLASMELQEITKQHHKYIELEDIQKALTTNLTKEIETKSIGFNKH